MRPSLLPGLLAAAALAALEEGTPADLLLTDYAMPGISGIELAARVRALRPGLPVLLITGFAEIGDASVDVPVLTKPFSGEQLQAAITALLADSVPG